MVLALHLYFGLCIGNLGVPEIIDIKKIMFSCLKRECHAICVGKESAIVHGSLLKVGVDSFNHFKGQFLMWVGIFKFGFSFLSSS